MSQAAERGRVLIVDDDPSTRVSLEGLLAMEHDVETVGSLDEALAALERAPVDVVLTDYEMPGGTGLELLSAIKEKHPNTMAIMLTGHPELAEVRAAEAEASTARVLAKPYDPKRLLRWVTTTVQLARLRQATNALRHGR